MSAPMVRSPLQLQCQLPARPSGRDLQGKLAVRASTVKAAGPAARKATLAHTRASRHPAQTVPLAVGGDGGNASGGGGGDGGNDGWHGRGDDGDGDRAHPSAPVVSLGLMATSLTLCAWPQAAEAADAKETLEAMFDQAIETAGPYVQEMGVSGVAGFVCAMTLKRLGKMVAVSLGFVFIGLQLLAAQGVVTIHWLNIEKRLIKAFDADGNGKLDADDAKYAYRRVMTYLSQGLPSVGGFYAGFALGLKF